MRLLLRFACRQGGASSAEYALILAVIGSAVAIAALNLGTAVGGSINDQADCMEQSSTC